MKVTVKLAFLYLFFIFVIGCKNDKTERKTVLLADREAPLGWIYLKMYDNETFEFISRGVRVDEDIYSGTYSFKNDTLYFKYKNSIPKAGSKAIIEKGFINYLDGAYPESIQIKSNNLK
ncbi:hypothetical protein JET18_05745 [Chryseobacterium sp. L7]|uniref:DUF4369 domain-containing protein n=1 Tax=Chryseobacterium endalhagicum TaxID=2797638 RepID=A0ABS1QDE8_9FLAO|nr:hypothetical protein [Chryseobacterium endalhagicum]MBL1220331.1 hypothetical protein [Chryseobacterium endalhagicum]